MNCDCCNLATALLAMLSFLYPLSPSLIRGCDWWIRGLLLGNWRYLANTLIYLWLPWLLNCCSECVYPCSSYVGLTLLLMFDVIYVLDYYFLLFMFSMIYHFAVFILICALKWRCTWCKATKKNILVSVWSEVEIERRTFWAVEMNKRFCRIRNQNIVLFGLI